MHTRLAALPAGRPSRVLQHRLRPGPILSALIGPRRFLAVLILSTLPLLAPLLPPSSTALAATSGRLATLASLEQSIRAAMAQAQSLRDDLDATPVVNEAADIAGIADGGARSTLAALRLATRAVDRRLEALRLSLPPGDDLERAELMLALRTGFGTLVALLEEMPRQLAGDPADRSPVTPADRRAREATLARLDQALERLIGAASALAALE